jgi:acyl-CoA synthetase (AMP-forming)/AMP-acid ligase II
MRVRRGVRQRQVRERRQPNEVGDKLVGRVGVPELPTLNDYLRLHALSRPEVIAVACDEFSFTYPELERAVASYAAAYKAAGLMGGEVVAVMGNSRPECLVAFLAACRMGAIYLGLNPKHTLSELAFIVNDSKPSVLLGMQAATEIEQIEKLRALTARSGWIRRVVTRPGGEANLSVSLAEFLEAARSAEEIQPANPEAPCAIVYTSGSTGSPKGALLSQRGMIRSALLSWSHWYGSLSPVRTVVQHPINHVGWLGCECASGLVAGGSLFFRERFDGAETLRLIKRERLNLWIGFPSMVMLAMQSAEFDRCDLSSLRRIAFGSLPTVEVLRRLRTKTDAVFSVSYGLTEANGGALAATDDGADFEAVATTVGRPLPGVEIRIIDGEGRPARSGELLVRDSCLFLGYLNRPEATAAALDAEGWLHTGDAVSEDPDGTLRMVGRLKEMFKSGGYNVYPTEIETVIGLHEAVSAVAVVEVPDPLWEEVGVAFVVPLTGRSVEVGELRDFARQRLANYKVPKRFVVVADLPRLANGKFDKVSLRSHARRAAEADSPGDSDALST